MIDPDTDDQAREQLISELERIEESVEYSAQSQLEHAKIWRVIHYVLGSIAAVLAAAAGGVGVTAFWPAPIAGAFAFASAGVAAIVTALQPAATYTRATQVGNEYLDLQAHARTFRNIDLPLLSIDDARVQLASIMERRHNINKSADPPFRRAYKRAAKNIEAGATEHAIDRN